MNRCSHFKPCKWWGFCTSQHSEATDLCLTREPDWILRQQALKLWYSIYSISNSVRYAYIQLGLFHERTALAAVPLLCLADAMWASIAERILSPSPGAPTAGLHRVCVLVIFLHLISGIFLLPFLFSILLSLCLQFLKTLLLRFLYGFQNVYFITKPL